MENPLIESYEEEILPSLGDSEALPEEKVVTEAEVKRLAHLPILTIFYLSLQRQIASTPVTALELAAYLGVDVLVAEELLIYLADKGMVRAFSDDIPAYSLGVELSEISAKDMIEMLGEFHELIDKLESDLRLPDLQASNEKYRRIYSELASEMLLLFGEESANQLPV